MSNSVPLSSHPWTNFPGLFPQTRVWRRDPHRFYWRPDLYVWIDPDSNLACIDQ